MSKINEVLSEVARVQQATGLWRKPVIKNDTLKLQGIKKGMDIQVDGTVSQAMVFPLEYGDVENEWTYLTADDINEVIGRMVTSLTACGA